MKHQIQARGDASPETEDAMVARRVMLKEPEAMAELYDRHGGSVYSVLIGILRDPWTAEELKQEVFLRVWNAIDCFDARRGDLKSWIAAIARNKAIDYLRSTEARARRCELGLDRLPGLPRESNLEAQIMARDLVRACHNAFLCLTEKQRQAFRLTYFEEKTHVQAATELGAPLGSVKTWVRTGLKRLREELVGAVGQATG